MAHIRGSIRSTLVNILKTDVTQVSNRVYDTPVRKLSTLPAIRVFTGEETAVPRSATGNTYVRTVTMDIEVVLSETEDYALDLDDVCETVENSIKNNPSISGFAQRSIYIGTRFEHSGEGNKPIVSAILTYNIVYTL